MTARPASRACERCGTPLEAEDLRCPTCGRALDAVGGSGARRERAEILRCDGCGAAVTYDAKARAPRCGFCGATTRLETPDDPVEQAEAFLPFTVPVKEARAALRRWLGSLGWFRPKNLASEATVASLQPLWWAAWEVEVDARASWAADSDAGSRRAAWAPHCGQGDLRLRSVVVPASKGLSYDECRALIPRFDLGTGVSKQPTVEGASVESFDMPRSAARRWLLGTLEWLATEYAKANWIPGRRFRKVRVALLLRHLASRRLALPTHVLAYRYRGRLHRALVHGQDASLVLGSAPISWLKVALVAAAALGALAVGALLLVQSA